MEMSMSRRLWKRDTFRPNPCTMLPSKSALAEKSHKIAPESSCAKGSRKITKQHQTDIFDASFSLTYSQDLVLSQQFSQS